MTKSAIDISHDEIPSEFQLISVYPNPFNPSTTIKITLTEPALVTLRIYDVLGREVEMLINSFLISGNYYQRFVADNLHSGIYYARILAGERSQTVKLVLLR
jgi:hypothetical protein